MSDDLVTIMVPSYNYAQFLTECVESAAAQRNVDVVVVDNGSTDDSPAIGAALAEAHENVRFVRHADNQGIIASFNRCRDEVRGAYAILLCADDCLTPGSVARSVDFMRDHPDVGLAYGPVTLFERFADVDLPSLAEPTQPPIVYNGADWVTSLCQSAMNPIRTPEAIMRTEVIERVGRLDPRCPHTSDLNMWMRIGAVSDIAFLPGPSQALYRVHNLMHSGRFPFYSSQDLEQRWIAYQAFLETVTDADARWHWETLARRRLADEARYAATRVFVAPEAVDRRDDVDLLLAFADRIDGAPLGLGERLGWSVRRALGSERSRWFPGFLPRSVVHRARQEQDDRRRERVGLDQPPKAL